MSSKTYLRILQGGIIASLIIILLVFKQLLFPYITSKQLPFNILMEILFALWLVFIMRFPEYRPKKNLISWGLIAYFLAILASCFISVDYNLSFWGDAERMLGFFHVAHFLIFYFVLITAFRTWKEWRVLLLSSVVIATAVSLFGLFGPNGYSTIGNTAYVSGYLIFSIYFIILLFFRSANKSARWFYALPLIPMLIEFWRMHTSGAIIGLSLSFLLMFLLIGLSHVNKKIRRGSLIIFVLAVIAIVGIFSQTKSAWFQASFLRNLTSEKVTFQTRLISWKGAAADFKYHPVFGTGYGNYAIIFDRHFTSDFYNYTTGDTYFDRAHNNIIDITSTTGLVGLLTYLSIFLAVIYYLWREFKANGKRVGNDYNGLNNLEIIIITSLVVAYFIQNLAIFDSFSTYLGLMTMLGFIYWLDLRRGAGNDTKSEEKQPRLVIKKDGTELAFLIGFLLIAYIFTNYYNVKTLRMFAGTIDGYALIASGNIVSGVDAYKNAFSGRPMERDPRTTLINLLIGNSSLLGNVDQARGQEIYDYVISLAKANVAYNPADSMMQMQLAQVLDSAAHYNSKNLERFNFYSAQAMNAIEDAIAASPGRATTYFVKAQMQLGRGENDLAIATMREGINLNQNYYEGYCRLSQLYFIVGNSKYGFDYTKYDSNLNETLNNCLDKGGVSQLGSEALLKMMINYYSDLKDYSHAAMLSEQLAKISTPDPEVWFNLAKLYEVIGSTTKAEETYQKAYALDPSIGASWLEFKKLVDTNRKLK
ncbi:MAG: O-antigen ligase family protein [Patescibacteria group bacterium]